jgi:hypothetical protein
MGWGRKNMSSHAGKILAALTDSGAKRFGLSCAALAAATTIGVAIYTEDPYRISRLAQQSLLSDRALKMGLEPYQAERQIRDACAKKSANIALSVECYDVEMFGGFGEILDSRRGLIRAEYYGLSLLAALAVALMVGVTAWALIAIGVPICLNYWAWLRGG